MEPYKDVPYDPTAALNSNIGRLLRTLQGTPTDDEVAAAAIVLERLGGADIEASERRHVQDALGVLRRRLEARVGKP